MTIPMLPDVGRPVADDTLAIPDAQALPTEEAEVLQLLRSVRFGHLAIQVHHGRIVNIERIEKILFGITTTIRRS